MCCGWRNCTSVSSDFRLHSTEQTQSNLKTFRNWRSLFYLRQVRALLVVERLPHDPLLDPPETLVVLRARQPATRHHQKKTRSSWKQSQEQSSSSPSSNAYHFPFGVHAHGDVDELLVEERHADLQAPGRGRLVGAQAVVLVQSFHLQILASGSSNASHAIGRSVGGVPADACVPCGRSPCGTPPCWARSGSRGSRPGARRSPPPRVPS